MVEEGRYFIDIITQLSAARAALRRVEQEVLRDHIGHCVREAMQSEDARTRIAPSRNSSTCWRGPGANLDQRPEACPLQQPLGLDAVPADLPGRRKVRH